MPVSIFRRFALLVAIAALLPAAAQGATPRNPDKLVILSTTDLKGKVMPCGCHTPKGGLSRLASFADSVRQEYGRVVLVDNGGFFPDDDVHKPYAWFVMDALKMLSHDVVGLGDRDLRFGYRYLKARAEQNQLPLVCANLYETATKKPAFRPWVIQDVDGVKVGFFGLMSDKADLGPGRDSLYVVEPSNTTQMVVAEMKKKGATVIVLLSQVGKVETEDLIAAVDGIDAAIVGRNTPLIQVGRTIKSTVVCYGGEQGQYVGRTLITVDKKGRPTARENETFMLGPQVADKPQVLEVMKRFEDAFNAELARLEKEKGATPAATTPAPADSARTPGH